MRHIMTTTALIWMSVAATVAARELDSPLPDAKQVKTIAVKFDHPKLHDVEFTATPEEFEAICAALLPAKRDPKPAKWECLGRIKIVKNDGQPFQIELYTTSTDPGAFAAGKTFEERVYYRGGKFDQLVKAVSAAYERSKKENK